jgi:hypothetical protein
MLTPNGRSKSGHIVLKRLSSRMVTSLRLRAAVWCRSAAAVES